MVRQRFIDMMVKSRNLEVLRKKQKQNWVIYVVKEIVCCFERKLFSILGMMIEVSRIFRQDRLFRKKYMGVCRRVLFFIILIINILFVRVSRQIRRKIENNFVFVLLRFGKFVRMNFVILLFWFLVEVIIFFICVII